MGIVSGICLKMSNDMLPTTETLAHTSLESMHMLIQWLSSMIFMLFFPGSILLLRFIWRKVLKQENEQDVTLKETDTMLTQQMQQNLLMVFFGKRENTSCYR